MKTIHVEQIVPCVKELCIKANRDLPKDVENRLLAMRQAEVSPTGKEILDQIIENFNLARNEEMAICQDTGFAVFFVRLGQEVHIEGGSLYEAINEGVRQGYIEGYLRKSILLDPLRRTPNSGDNTPAIVHIELVPGEEFNVIIAPKGGGSENMSEVRMFPPSAGLEGVKKFLVERVTKAGGNPCPPVVVGMGIGGTFEKCAYLAKKALLREVGSVHPDPYYAALETEFLQLVNDTGVGPMGLGGTQTAIAVFIETHPLHIASFPVAINMNCHAARHAEFHL